LDIAGLGSQGEFRSSKATLSSRTCHVLALNENI